MKQSKKLLGLGIVLAGVLSLGAISISSLNKQVNQQADASVGNYSTNASTYYNSITATSGQQLAAQLHDLITSTHQKYTTYDDNGKNLYQQNTDQYYENGVKVSGYIYEFYSGVKWPNGWYPNAGQTNGGYNREHLWCQSLSVDGSGHQMWGETGGGADMHHLRPSETRLNSTRSNSPYGTISNREDNKVYAKFGDNAKYAVGGYKTGDVFEPLDNKKGDVARIILYTYLHYNSYTCSTLFGSYGTTNGSGSSSYFTSNFLSLTKVTSKSTESAALAMLLDWNTSDPVDDIETRRNEQVAIYQGNRNPFIDNPSYADMIWGSGQPSTPTVTSVTVNPSTLNLDLNGTTTSTLSATVYGTNSPAQTVTWTSSNTSVATVSSSGVVTAKALGTATITATSTVDTTKSGTCTVSVINSIPTVDSVTVSPNSLNLDLNGTTTGTLTASVVGTNNPADTVTWTSSNTSIATVSNSGVVTAKAVGTATITATSTVDSTKSGTCDVTVVDTTSTVTSVTLSKSTLELNLSGTKTSTLTATVIGNYDPAQTVTWFSSNTSVATVDNGLVTAIAVGTSTITARSTIDVTKYATCTVTVINETNKGQTPDNPYTVAEALALLQELGDQTSSTVYVRGIISSISEVSTSYGNATFNISDDGTTSNQLKVFRCKNVGNVKFTSEDEISVGDEVIITGVLKNYTSGNTTTPEFDSGCYIYSKGTIIPPTPVTGGHTFTKVTSVDDLKDGTYVIVYESSSLILDSSLSSIDVASNYQSIVFSNDRFDVDVSYAFTIKAMTGGYSIKTSTGKYLTHSGSNNTLPVSTSEVANTISFSDGNVIITASDGYILKYNSTSGQTRFRYYSATSSQKSIQLYRMEDERFADLLLDSMTCNANGTSAPVFSTSWYELSLNYAFMSDTSKTYFTTSSANENGNLVEQAIARYEYIIGKYGTTTYDNFMERSGLSSNKMVAAIDKQNNIIIITACLSAFTLLSLAMVFVSRKKEEQ